MHQRAAGGGQGDGRGDVAWKTALPTAQPSARLVVEFIVDERDAAAMIGVVPAGNPRGERGDLPLGAFGRPLRAGEYEGRGGEQERRDEETWHGEHPCSELTGPFSPAGGGRAVRQRMLNSS